MKSLLCLLLVGATAVSARAEVFRSGTRHDARGRDPVSVHRSHDHGRRDYGHRDHHSGTHVHVGFGYGRSLGYYGSPWYYSPRWSGHYGYYSPYRAYGYVPAYGYYPGYGDAYPYYGSTGTYYGNTSYAANGLVLGALAGGIIGHNSGEFRHNGWRGAAWGAGLGWLLGAVADSNRRTVINQSAPVHVPSAAQVQAQPQMAAPAQAQPVTIINNYYNSSTPMSGANSLFGR